LRAGHLRAHARRRADERALALGAADPGPRHDAHELAFTVHDSGPQVFGAKRGLGPKGPGAVRVAQGDQPTACVTTAPASAE